MGERGLRSIMVAAIAAATLLCWAPAAHASGGFSDLDDFNDGAFCDFDGDGLFTTYATPGDVTVRAHTQVVELADGTFGISQQVRMNDVPYVIADGGEDETPGPVTAFFVDGIIAVVAQIDTDGTLVEGESLKLQWSWRLTGESGESLRNSNGVIHTFTPEDVTNGDNQLWTWSGPCREP